MAQGEPTFNIIFETMVACSNRGEEYLKPLHYNEFVNMIVRDSRWPVDVSFVATNPTQGKLMSRNWTKVDFPNLIETLVVSGYIVTITDANVYEVTKALDMATTRKKHAPTMSAKKGKKKHTGALHPKSPNFSRRVADVSSKH